MQGVEYTKDSLASLCSLERVVRLPAYRGPLDRRNWGRRLRRGNDGRCRREGLNGGTSVPEGKTSQWNDPSGNGRVLARTRNRLAIGNRGSGNRLAIKEPTGKKLLGLTPPSSATEAGDARLRIQRNPDRQPPFAGARC